MNEDNMTISGEGLFAFLTSTALSIRAIDSIQPHKLTQDSFLLQLEAASRWVDRQENASLSDTEEAELIWLIEQLKGLVERARGLPLPQFYNPS